LGPSPPLPSDSGRARPFACWRARSPQRPTISADETLGSGSTEARAFLAGILATATVAGRTQTYVPSLAQGRTTGVPRAYRDSAPVPAGVTKSTDPASGKRVLLCDETAVRSSGRPPGLLLPDRCRNRALKPACHERHRDDDLQRTQPERLPWHEPTASFEVLNFVDDDAVADTVQHLHGSAATGRLGCRGTCPPGVRLVGISSRGASASRRPPPGQRSCAGHARRPHRRGTSRRSLRRVAGRVCSGAPTRPGPGSRAAGR
jgi:hypothetical protein